MSENALNFKLEVFEGPLDLLLSLITKNKIDICDIPISLILDQYMEYLDEMKKMDMDIAGEFISMAAELMLIKSRMLFPKTEEEEEDPRAELAQTLLEYQKAKEAANLLGPMFSEYSGRFVKDREEIKISNDEPLRDLDALLLQKAFQKLLERNRLYTQSPEKVFAPLLTHRMVPVPEKILSIMKYLRKNGITDFETLMLMCSSKSELVASFMAVLELAKSGRIILSSDENETLFIELETRKVIKNNGE